MNKAMKDGKSILAEGMYLDPGMYLQELVGEQGWVLGGGQVSLPRELQAGSVGT